MAFKKGNIYGRLNKGKSTWNKGLTGVKTNKKGGISPRKGVILTDDIKKKISNNLKLQYKKGLLKGAFKKGSKIRNTGKTRFKKGQMSGKNNVNWKGGKSFEEYPKGWLKLREVIRKRDKYTCQICGCRQKYLKNKLCVHHLDEDKQNISKNNLISICKQCHTIIHRRKSK